MVPEAERSVTSCYRWSHCEIFTGKSRLLVPCSVLSKIFRHLHSISHSGARASIKLISDRYV